ncbi:hypothetical protein [Streptomyces sp. NPDC051218]|uniref:hypothetical protein n=1 Tax=Streptomyces sp. NPDC051218 TaxID=3365645 RepID=UPI0037994911
MRKGHTLPLSAAVLAVVLMSGCADEQGGNGEKEWEPDDALRRAEQALKAAADDDTEADLVDSGTAYVGSGLKKSFRASGDKPYRFELTCDTDDSGDLTLTLSRGTDEQAYGIGCGDRKADHFNLPPDKPFTTHVKADPDGTGLIAWRLTTIAPGDVDGCEDDVDGCEG